MKSTVEQIRARFDNDVERFSNLDTGQTAAMDAALALDLISRAAAAATPRARSVLDVGCGAGNFTLKLLERIPNLEVTLLDLSRPMLDRARDRVAAVTRGRIETLQADVREASLGVARYDVALAAAVLHHLREDAEWLHVFAKLHAALRPGGSLWIFDMVQHSVPAVEALMWARYGDYLTGLRGEPYRDEVFAYIEREDTPRPLLFQVDRLREAGFKKIEILHKNGSFAAFGAVKTAR